MSFYKITRTATGAGVEHKDGVPNPGHGNPSQAARFDGDNVELHKVAGAETAAELSGPAAKPDIPVV